MKTFKLLFLVLVLSTWCNFGIAAIVHTANANITLDANNGTNFTSVNILGVDVYFSHWSFTASGFQIDGDNSCQGMVLNNSFQPPLEKLNAGDPVSSAGTFVTPSNFATAYHGSFANGGGLITNGQFTYFGFRIIAGGNTHYAWLKLTRTSDAVAVINEYAYENTAGQAINAGSTGAGATAPEIVVNQNGTNINDGGNHSFGTTLPGTPINRTFTIENTGNANLTVNNPTISGANAADFSVTSNPTSPVAGGNNTTFIIQFNPSSAGAKTAMVSFGNNDANENPFNFTLNGTGNTATAPEIAVNQNGTNINDGGNHSFGTTLIGTPVNRTFTIENNGNANLTVNNPTISGANAADFSVTSNPTSPVAGGNNTTFIIQFNPSSAGAKTAMVSFGNNDANENPFNFTLNGTGNTATAPEIAVDQNGTNINDGGNHSFGTTLIGTPVNRTFTIENNGNANLTVNNPTISGANAADFSVTSNPTSPVAGGNNTTFIIQFNPSSAGAKTAMVSFGNNDANENPFNFTLNGTGNTATAPEIAVDQNGTNINDGGNHSFGTTLIGTPVNRTFTIENTGNANLTVNNPTISGANAADFSVTSNPTSPVAGGNNTTFIIQFNPSSAGAKTAMVSFGNNDANENPFNFTLNGTGNIPPNWVQSISITVPNNDTTFFRGTILTPSAQILPTNASNTNVTWSIIDETGSGTINVNSGAVLGQQSGTIIIVAKADDGSNVSDSIRLLIKDPTGVNDLDNTSVTVYPNPFSNYLKIDELNEIETKTINIYSVTGELLVSKVVEDQLSNIHLEINISNGVYLLELVDINNNSYQKLLVRDDY